MTAKKFYDWQTSGGTDDVMRLVDCLERSDIPWCAIGGVAVTVAQIPAHESEPDWVWYPETGTGEKEYESNELTISTGGISRDNRRSITQRIYTRILEGDEENPELVFKLQITNVVRTNYSVQIFAKAWLEGSAGDESYYSWQYADGSGISMVVENAQDPHLPASCNVQV